MCLAIYTLSAYGGVRSTDSEIVFRTAESIAREGRFEVEEGVLWEGFGLAKGQDGRSYSIFGPTQSLMLVPFILAAEAIDAPEWIHRLPVPLHPSHQVGQGLFYYVGSVDPVDWYPHALRAAVSVFNVLVSSLTVVLFWIILRTLGHSSRTATLTSILLAFGSLLWPYSGTFFSEPLATLMVLLSFLLLFPKGQNADDLSPTRWSAFISGVFLGVAGTVHITAILFMPFFLLLTGTIERFSRFDPGRLKRAGGLFTLGFLIPMMFLLYYNYARFGSFLETGRSVDASLSQRLFYGEFTLPFLGLYGLLIGGAKGLLVTSPSTVLGFLSWRQFTRRHNFLAHVLLAMVVFRILFIASRTDWHGGYCIGPRYLVMIIPFILLPVASWLEGPGADKLSVLTLSLMAAVCVSVQLHFALGEIFTFYYLIKWTYAPDGIAALKVPYPYLSWKFSPLTSLPPDYRGPWLLESIHKSNRTLWIWGTALVFPVQYYLMKWGRSQRKSGTDKLL